MSGKDKEIIALKRKMNHTKVVFKDSIENMNREYDDNLKKIIEKKKRTLIENEFFHNKVKTLKIKYEAIKNNSNKEER